MNLIISFVLLVTVSCAIGEVQEKASYDGFRLVRVSPMTDEHIEMLGRIEENIDFDVWTGIRAKNASLTVLLSPQSFPIYSTMFNAMKIPFVTLSENIKDLFEEQDRSMIRTKYDTSIVGKYATYAQIQNFIDEVVRDHPNIASSYVAGKTYENRNLKVLVLKTSTSKRNVWIDCGIHAREWVSPSACIWMANELVSGYNSGNSEVVALLNYYEVHILPLLNPDGYDYSHSTMRMWRKNRARNAGSNCIGTDLNRNFGFKWRTGGSSYDPCSDTYAGSSADSELETKALEAAIMRTPSRWDAYITIHSYGLWWFTPYGYTDAVKPSNYAELVSKALIGKKAFDAVNGLQMVYPGTSSGILYVASGGSEDWAYGTAGIPYSYCLELRPSQYGTDSNYGFALPENRAPLAGRETWAGVKAFLNSIKK